jgi:hypothetical protein
MVKGFKPDKYKIELARTGRSKCKMCKDLIETKDMRIGKTVMVDGREQLQWYHTKCVVALKELKDAKLSDIPGYTDMTSKNKKLLISTLSGSDSPSQPNQPTSKSDQSTSKPAKSATPKPAPKSATKSTPSSAYTPQQLSQLKDIKESLEDETIANLKEMCKKNSQKVTGTKKELIERIADGKVLGSIPLCPSCGGGRPRFDSGKGTYLCPGFMEDDKFVNCNKKFNMSEIIRNPWTD